MGRPAILKVDIIADAKGVHQGVDQAESRFSKLGKTAKTAGKVMGLGLLAAGAVAVKFGKDSVDAFVEAQAAQAKLSDAFARFPKLADVNINSLRDLNSQLALKTKFDDDATASGQAVLAQFGLTGTQLRTLTPLMQDYAAKTGKDLPTAAKDLGKALLGNGKALKNIGVNFKDTGSQTGNLKELVGGLRTQVGGFAEKEGKTGAGQAAILKNQFGELQEAVGAKLVPVLSRLAGWIVQRLIPAAQHFGAQLAANLGPAIRRVGAFITGTLVPAASKLYTWFVTKIVPAIRSYVTPVLAGLRSAFSSVSSSINGNSGNLSKLARFLGVVIPPVAKVLATILGTVLGTAFKVLGKAIGVQIDILSRFIGFIDSAIGKVRSLAGAVGKVGGVIGKFIPHSASVAGMTPQLVTPGGHVSPTTGGMAHASWAAASAGTATLRQRPTATVAGGVTYVDARSFTGTVEGEVIDRLGTAAAIEKLLRDYAIATGKRPAFGAPS